MKYLIVDYKCRLLNEVCRCVVFSMWLCCTYNNPTLPARAQSWSKPARWAVDSGSGNTDLIHNRSPQTGSEVRAFFPMHLVYFLFNRFCYVCMSYYVLINVNLDMTIRYFYLLVIYHVIITYNYVIHNQSLYQLHNGVLYY